MKKIIIIPLVFILLTAIVVGVGFVKLNILPEFNFGNILGVNSTGEFQIKSNAEIIAELKNDFEKKLKKNSLSDNMNGIWIDISSDFSEKIESGTEAVKYAVYSDIDFYRNFIPDTVFIVPDIKDEFSVLKESDGSDFDVLAYLLYYVKTVDCTPVLVVNDSFFDDGDINLKAIGGYLSAYDFSGVLMSIDSSYGNDTYVDFAEKIYSHLQNYHQHIVFGVEIHSDKASAFADKYVSELFERKLVDFGYVDLFTTTANADYPFESVALWWNYFADYYNIPVYCEHRPDMIFSNDEEWGLSTEINSQLKALYDCFAIKGSVYYKSSVLKTKKALARDLAIFLNDVSGVNQDAFYISSLSFADEKAVFGGKCYYDGLSVFCDDVYVKTELSQFEKTVNLKPGMNTCRFTADAASYEYNIYSTSSVFNSYYPVDSINIGTEYAFSPYAVCPENSQVYAVINGKYYCMNSSDELSSVNYPDGYDVYSCSISFFGEEFYSGKLSLVCINGDIFETVQCGEIFLSFASMLANNNSANSDDIAVDSGISPFTNNGLGNSLMCMVKYDNTEIISDISDYDTYHPYNSMLPEGTIDYIQEITCSPEGYLRYELKSGLSIYGVNSILVYNGYTLPLNKIAYKSLDISSSAEEFVFLNDWRAPVNITQQPLSYEKGYESYSFNISSYDCQYIDVNFYYSSDVLAVSSINLSESQLFSHCELLSESDRTILRFYLKNQGNYYGSELIFDDNNQLRIIFKKPLNNGIAGKTVMLDPGHGGIAMVGTAVSDNSVSESQITLAIALRAKSYLESMGAKVLMTRTMDTSLSLSERTAYCVENNPDIFVSIHCDGSDSAEQCGTHTFYFTPYSQPLADSIHRSLVNMYLNAIYIEADANYSSVDRKIKNYPFYVTRVDCCPSVLVELGFLTNYVEGLVLSNPINQDYLGKAIAEGIAHYFN